MTIKLIEGHFDAKDALEIISKMIDIKIKFHESKIADDINEEDVKLREAKIKRLQNDLWEIRNFIKNSSGKINVQSEINLSK